jgi:putative ABC transport system ATP-binding protein
MDLLRRIAVDQAAAILVVTHDESIFNRFDRIFHLRDGWLVSVEEVGKPRQAGAVHSPRESAVGGAR